MTEKVCKKCGVKKKLTEFFAHKHTKDRVQSWCKQCKRDDKKKKYKKKESRDTATQKECRCCKKLVDRSNFYKTNASGDGLFFHCKPCCRRNDKIKRNKMRIVVPKRQKTNFKGPFTRVQHAKKWTTLMTSDARKYIVLRHVEGRYFSNDLDSFVDIESTSEGLHYVVTI